MKSSKVTPIGMEEEEEKGGGDCNPLSTRKKRISFKAKPSLNDRENISTVSYYASLPVTFSPAHEDGDDNKASAIKRERTFAKTASCPTQVFQQPAMTSEKLSQNDNQTAVINSTRKLASGRRRAHSMPTGSLASHNFFGDTTDAHQRYSSAGVSIGRCKLEKVHEDHTFLNSKNDHVEVKDHASVEVGKEAQVAKKEKIKTCTATTMTMKGESRDDTTQQNGTASAKCQCIIL